MRRRQFCRFSHLVRFRNDCHAFALREFKSRQGRLGWLQATVESKDPPHFMVLFTNIAAIIGVLLAAAGLLASKTWRETVFDGAASITIGLLLAAVAWISARESKKLLIGEGASEGLTDSIVAAAFNELSVEGVTSAIAVGLAPDQVVATLVLEFYDDLRAPQIEEAVVSLAKRMREQHPQVVALFVKPQTKRTFEETRGDFHLARFENGERLSATPNEASISNPPGPP
jgi:divalent metal cation (Fe/Co/Zn/Cd) transporter